MPLQRDLYPANWTELSDAIRARANYRCQECGLPCRRTGEARDSYRRRLATMRPELLAEYDRKPQRFSMTVSHTDRDPNNCDPSNLRALCVACHLRYDAKYNAGLSRETRRRRAEAADV